MNKSESPRLIGVIIFLIGIFLIGFNAYLAIKQGKFYGIAAFLGPIGALYGFAVILRPPVKMPQTEFTPFHKRFFGAGMFLGVVYLLILMFVDLHGLFK